MTVDQWILIIGSILGFLTAVVTAFQEYRHKIQTGSLRAKKKLADLPQFKMDRKEVIAEVRDILSELEKRQ